MVGGEADLFDMVSQAGSRLGEKLGVVSIQITLALLDRMPGDPHSGSKVWEAPDREIGKPGENRGQIVAHRDFQPAAAFHDRENRCNLRSRLWTADVQPVLSTESHRTH